MRYLRVGCRLAVGAGLSVFESARSPISVRALAPALGSVHTVTVRGAVLRKVVLAHREIRCVDHWALQQSISPA
jgi:hypothetical protein